MKSIISFLFLVFTVAWTQAASPSFQQTTNIASGESAKTTNNFLVKLSGGNGNSLTNLNAWAVSPSYISGLQMRRVNTNRYAIDSGMCSIQASNQSYSLLGSWTNITVGLQSNKVYYVYAYQTNNGFLGFEAFTNEPVTYFGTASSKIGDASRRYIGSFVTDVLTNTLPFTHVPDSGIIYYSQVPTALPYRVLNGGQATTSTAISMPVIIPSTADSAEFRISQTDATAVLYVGILSVDATSNFSAFLAPVATDTARLTVWLPVAGQSVFYIFSSSPTGSASIVVQGYHFNR